MAKAASSEELGNAIREHLEVTTGQVQRLEQVFAALGERPKSRPCAGMRGLIEEGRHIMEEDMEDSAMDLALTKPAVRLSTMRWSDTSRWFPFCQAVGEEAGGAIASGDDERRAAGRPATCSYFQASHARSSRSTNRRYWRGRGQMERVRADRTKAPRAGAHRAGVGLATPRLARLIEGSESLVRGEGVHREAVAARPSR